MTSQPKETMEDDLHRAGSDAQDAEEQLENVEWNHDGQGLEGGGLKETGFYIQRSLLKWLVFHFPSMATS